jgi:hypothetical protein
VNFGQIADGTYAYLGTSSSDKAFPRTRVNRWINDALNALYADLPAGYLQVSATWAADASTLRRYTLASQSPAVTALRKIVTLRLNDADGAALREAPFDQLDFRAGNLYAVTGADEAAVLHVSLDVEPGTPLYAVYEAWPSELTDDGHSPTALPSRFHDIPALMAAKAGFASGDESRWPDTYETLLSDRTAQFYAHVGRRSADASYQREPSGAAI